MISACSSAEHPAPPVGFFVTIYSDVSCSVPPLRQRSPFHWHVLFSSPSSVSSASSFSSSGVQTYSQCLTHVLRMTKLTAILTPHMAEWKGKYRAVEEWGIHPSAFTPIAMCALAERRVFPLPKVHYVLEQRSLINFRWITIGECSEAHSKGLKLLERKNRGCKHNKLVGSNTLGGISRWSREIGVIELLCLWSSTRLGSEMLHSSAPHHGEHIQAEQRHS